jgi:two-component system, chemotaxis family, response regulator Rcp1
MPGERWKAMLSQDKMKVLVVEDNSDDIAIIKRAMRKSEMKCDLFFARDGQEAIDFLWQRTSEYEDAPRPDLILLDLNLPKVDGLDVLAKIKDDDKLRRIPVIVLTISLAQQDMIRAYDSGAASYMNKPVDSKDFERLIQTVQEYWRIASLPTE